MSGTLGIESAAPTAVFRAAALLALCMTLVGCQSTTTRVDVVNYLGSGEVERFAETFEESYYDRDAHGNVHIVLRRSSRNGDQAADLVSQIIHLETIWRSIPGRTVAHSTQLNGTISYCIVGPSVAATFEGAGSIFYKHKKRTDELIGSIDLARLKPVRQISEGVPLFEHAELSGTFRAKYDPLRVTTLVNEMNRVFGPERSADVAALRPSTGKTGTSPHEQQRR